VNALLQACAGIAIIVGAIVMHHWIEPGWRTWVLYVVSAVGGAIGGNAWARWQMRRW